MKLRQMLGNRTINYDKYANGIYILHTTGLLFKRDKWNLPNDEAVGVAVISDNCKFVIAPDECMDYIRWGPYQAMALVPGATTSANLDVALQDYEGIRNTNAHVAYFGSKVDYAAGWCKQYVFKNGKNGYMGAAGEWNEVLHNLSEIDQCLSKIGGIVIDEYREINDYYCTSTQSDDKYTWAYVWDNYDFVEQIKESYFRVRAFTSLNNNE